MRGPVILSIGVVGLLALACGGRVADEHSSTSASEVGDRPPAGDAAVLPEGHRPEQPVPSSAPSSDVLTGTMSPDTKPNTVGFRDGTGAVDELANSMENIPCFSGFTAALDGLRVQFSAFVFEPGDYEGDSLYILYMRVVTQDGRVFVANDGNMSIGDITLHVDSVRPRFVGEVDAILIDEVDAEAPPLELSLAFDVLSYDSCFSE